MDGLEIYEQENKSGECCVSRRPVKNVGARNDKAKGNGDAGSSSFNESFARPLKLLKAASG
jgi:hypothetical protein